MDSNRAPGMPFDASVGIDQLADEVKAKMPPRRLRVERHHTTDERGESVDIMHCTNGVVGLEQEYGYGSPWAQSHCWATIKGIPYIACCSDVWNKEDGSQARGPYIDADPTHAKYGFSFWTQPTELRFYDSTGVEFDPEGLSDADTSFSMQITRWIGRGGDPWNVTASKPQFDFTENATPEIFIADTDSTDPAVATALFRNDKGAHSAGLSLHATGAGSAYQAMIGKVVEWDGKGHESGGAQKVRIFFYISAVHGTGGSLSTMLFPGQKANGLGRNLVGFNNYTLGFGYSAGTGGAWTAGAWNYIDVSADHFVKGTNLIVFDGIGMSTTNYLEIGVDTTVVSTMRNKAYQLYAEEAGYWRHITHRYTFYRDSDKIDMTPSIQNASSTLTNSHPHPGNLLFTYNFGLCHATYRHSDRADYPFGERFPMLGYKDQTLNRLQIANEGVIIPGDNVAWSITDGAPYTIAAPSAAAGQKDVILTADPSAGVRIGMPIKITDGTNSELNYIASINAGTKTITFANNLQHTYTSAAASKLYRGGWAQQVSGSGQTALHLSKPTYDIIDKTVRFWDSADPTKFLELSIDKNGAAATFGLQLALEQIPNNPFWWGVVNNNFPTDSAVFNDIVLYTGTIVAGAFVLDGTSGHTTGYPCSPGDTFNTVLFPKVTLDLTGMVAHF